MAMSDAYSNSVATASRHPSRHLCQAVPSRSDWS
jgi:hypothetical protein